MEAESCNNVSRTRQSRDVAYTRKKGERFTGESVRPRRGYPKGTFEASKTSGVKWSTEDDGDGERYSKSPF